MNCIELTERLIEDLKKSTKAVNTARTVSQDILRHAVEKTWIELSFQITLPHRLLDLARFINFHQSLLPYQKDKPIDPNNFLKDIELHKINVSEAFQKIQDKRNLVDANGYHLQTLFSRVESMLDEIHAEAQRLENCYQSIVAYKNE